MASMYICSLQMGLAPVVLEKAAFFLWAFLPSDPT